MARKPVCDGLGLRLAFEAATAALERRAAKIDALNVFPVPDRDTGTNMLMTMRAALAEVTETTNREAKYVAARLAHGALIGARGSSGVILSQIIRGLAVALSERETFGPRDIALGLQFGAQAAYEAVSQPKEGTILTVARAVAEAASFAAEAGDVAAVLDAAVVAGRAAVAETSHQLSVLREAGVVDAGGEGLLVLLEAVLRLVRGEAEDSTLIEQVTAAWNADTSYTDCGRGNTYGYCTSFVIQTNGSVDLPTLRDGIEALGESTLVVLDGSIARIHVHTFDPGKALSYAAGWGTLHNIRIENMQEQYERSISEHSAAQAPEPADRVSVIAIAPHFPVAALLRSLGAVAVGEDLDAGLSAEQVAQAIDAVPANEVLVLPSDERSALVAERLIALTRKRARVLPIRNVPQAVAAMLVFDRNASLEDNAVAMKAAIASAQIAEVTTSASFQSLKCAAAENRTDEDPGQMARQAVESESVVGAIGGQPVATGPNAATVALDLLRVMGADVAEIITIYYGTRAEKASAQNLAACIEARYPSARVELIDSGQPDSLYLLSVD